MKIIRFLVAAYWVATFVAALVLSGFRDPPFWKVLLVGLGLVFYVVAAAGLLMAHAKERRPILELPAVLAYPVLAYHLAVATPAFRSGLLWMFIGLFQFVALAGGFLLGIVLSPVAALYRGAYPGEVRTIVQVGLRFVAGLRLTVFAVLLFGGTIAGVAALGSWLANGLGDLLTPAGRIVTQVSSGSAVLAVALFTFRHTTFNLLRDPALRERYTAPRH